MGESSRERVGLRRFSRISTEIAIVVKRRGTHISIPKIVEGAGGGGAAGQQEWSALMASRGEFYDGKQQPYLTPAPLGEGGGVFAAPQAVKNSYAAQAKGMLAKQKLHPTTYLLDSAQSLPLCVCVCVCVCV